MDLDESKEMDAKADVRDALPTEAALSQLFEGLQGRYNDPFDHKFSTGFPEIDSLTAGLHPEDLVVIGGRPMSGKTALALGISQYVGVKNQSGVIFFTPESTSTLMATRLVAALSRVPIGAIRSGRDIDGSHWEQIVNSVRILKQARIWIDDTPGLTPEMMRSKVFQIAEDHGAPQLIVVDNLQQMRVPGLRGNRTAEVTEVARSLKELAKEARVPTIATSHLVRATERGYGNNSRPILSDLRDSGAIEDIADGVLLLNRRDADPEMLEVIVAKQKHGPTGSVLLRFLESFSLVESIQTTDDREQS